ncbi:MAG: hypothetical protein ACRYE7_01565 [Janthinobacterium lividum]
MAVSAYERESTLRVPISRDVFNRVNKLLININNDNVCDFCECSEEMPDVFCQLCFKSNNDQMYDLKETVVLIFDNNARLASREYQTKRMETREHVAVLFDGNFYPMLRTRALETPLALPSSLELMPEVTKSVYRIIVTRCRGSSKMRLSYNKEEDKNGVFYNIACETEYECDTDYDTMIRLENLMLKEYLKFFKCARFPLDAQNLNDLFACVVPKVQMWSCYNPTKNYRWAYKWNGIKAKLMIKGDVAFLWPDADAVHTKKYNGDLKILNAINFQVELMSTSIVLIHAISVSFFDKIYVIEPYTSVALLDHVRPIIKGSRASIQGMANDDSYLPICVQEFFDAPKPTSYDETRFDGFILTQDTMFIKWKQPTVDARYMGAGVFQIGNDTQMVKFQLDDSEHVISVCEVDGIYELSPKLSILRKRTDRLLCSTYREYEIFVKSVKLMNGS